VAELSRVLGERARDVGIAASVAGFVSRRW
jgi:hypothetical protein